jgi:hypothetical protein
VIVWTRVTGFLSSSAPTESTLKPVDCVSEYLKGDDPYLSEEHLKQIARRCHLTKAQAAEEIARYVLHLFPVNCPLRIESPTLKTQRDRLLALYERVYELGGKRGDLEADSGIQRVYLDRFGATDSKAERIKELIREAFGANDTMRSFPHIFKAQMSALIPEIEARQITRGECFRLMDTIVSTQQKNPLYFTGKLQEFFKTHSCHCLAQFLFKQIALYYPKELAPDRPIEWQAWTWDQLAKSWIHKVTKKNIDGMYAVNRQCPLYVLLQNPLVYPPTGVTEMSFKDLAFEMTVRALEQRLGLQLESQIRAELLSQCEDEDVRKEIVFYTGHIEELIAGNFDVSCKASSWLIKLRRFFELQKRLEEANWTIARPNTLRVIFHWLFHLDEKVPLSVFEKQSEAKYIDAIVADAEKFQDLLTKEATKKGGLEILLELISMYAANSAHQIGQFFAHSDWTKTECSLEEVKTFIQTRGYVQYDNQRHAQLVEFLTNCKATGKSSFLITHFKNPYSPPMIAKARKLVNDWGLAGLSSRDAFEILESVCSKGDNLDRELAAVSDLFPSFSREEKVAFLTTGWPQFNPARLQAAKKELETIGLRFPFTPYQRARLYMHLLKGEDPSLNFKWALLTRLATFSGSLNWCTEFTAAFLCEGEEGVRALDGQLSALSLLRDQIASSYARAPFLPSEDLRQIEALVQFPQLSEPVQRELASGLRQVTMMGPAEECRAILEGFRTPDTFCEVSPNFPFLFRASFSQTGEKDDFVEMSLTDPRNWNTVGCRIQVPSFIEKNPARFAEQFSVYFPETGISTVSRDTKEDFFTTLRGALRALILEVATGKPLENDFRMTRCNADDFSLAPVYDQSFASENGIDILLTDPTSSCNITLGANKQTIKVPLTYQQTQTPQGLAQVTLTATYADKPYSLTMHYPQALMQNPGEKKKALHWQLALLKSRIYHLNPKGLDERRAYSAPQPAQ